MKNKSMQKEVKVIVTEWDNKYGILEDELLVVPREFSTKNGAIDAWAHKMANKKLFTLSNIKVMIKSLQHVDRSNYFINPWNVENKEITPERKGMTNEELEKLGFIEDKTILKPYRYWNNQLETHFTITENLSAEDLIFEVFTLGQSIGIEEGKSIRSSEFLELIYNK